MLFHSKLHPFCRLLLFLLSPIRNCCHISGHLLAQSTSLPALHEGNLQRPQRLHCRHRPSDILMIFRVRIFCVCNFPALNCFYVFALPRCLLLLLLFRLLLFSILYNFIYFLVSRRVFVDVLFAQFAEIVCEGILNELKRERDRDREFQRILLELSSVQLGSNSKG